MVNAALRAALQELREANAVLGDDAPVTGIALEGDGGVIFSVVRAGAPPAPVTICFREAEAYPNSGAFLFGTEGLSALNERFQDRGELKAIVAEVLRVLGCEADAPHSAVPLRVGTGSGASAMEEDAVAPEAAAAAGGGSGSSVTDANGDVGMAEGSEDNDDWDAVASASDSDGGNDEFGGSSEQADKEEEEPEVEEEGNDDSGGGDDDDDDDQASSDDDEERDMIILCSSSLGRWERFEAIAEAEAESGKQVLSSSHGVAARRQIFNPREAFSMLSRELLDFLKGRHSDCSVETGGDDIYHWVVDLGSFAEGSQLAKDMREVSRRYFYSTVRLRIRFMRGLHPFFPPSVEVVWPHLAGPMLGAVASHPMLALENWDPWRPAMETVAQIKGFLEAVASVDLDNPVNDIRRYSTSTYTALERGLARLEALSGVAPRCVARAQEAALYAARDSYDKDSARLQALAEGGKKRGRKEEDKDKDKPTGPGAAKRNREVVWARGTGYGSGHDKTAELWDAKATEAAQRARDEEIRLLLVAMSDDLRAELGPRPGQEQAAAATGEPAAGRTGIAANVAAGVGPAAGAKIAAGGTERGKVAEGEAKATEPGAGGGPSAMEGVETAATTAASGGGGGGGSSSAAGGGAAAAAAVEGEPRLGPEGCATVIRESCLLPFTVRELQMASFTDMGARNAYYSALLGLLRELCRPATHSLLWQPTTGQQHGGGNGSVAALFNRGLKSAARMYLNVLRPSNEAAAKAAAAAAAAAGASTSTAAPATRPPDKAALAAENAAKEAEATQRMAQVIMQVAAYMEAHAPQQQRLQEAEAAADAAAAAAAGGGGAAGASGDGAAGGAERAGSGAGASTSAAAAAVGGATGPNLYVTTLKPLQMDAVPNLGRAHHYATAARSEAVAPRTRAVRLAKEVASLESLLPLSDSSSVFVRVDETAVQMWKAVVVGPEDTPYSGGLFFFDFYFPPQYPNAPPQVHLTTTGGGRVRFNPNLYADGKVCLSLLGTWSGDRGETWNADVSTAVQVLISIQSLIMVPQPYFNEPGYEGQTEDRGRAASREYTRNVRENCIRYAMLDVLRHPPAAFAEVVRHHFRLRRQPLLDQLAGWAAETAAFDAPSAARMTDMRKELEGLMAAMAP